MTRLGERGEKTRWTERGGKGGEVRRGGSLTGEESLAGEKGLAGVV